MELVQRVFDRLREVGLKCHPEKCCFAAKEVEYLGMWLRPGVVSPQVAKVAAIAALPQPTDVTSVRAFSGVVNYYRQFIPDYSCRLQAPLNALTKKGANWEWGPDQEGAFQALKEACRGNRSWCSPRGGGLSRFGVTGVRKGSEVFSCRRMMLGWSALSRMGAGVVTRRSQGTAASRGSCSRLCTLFASGGSISTGSGSKSRAIINLCSGS
jgi:hypothetical protein